MEQDRNLRFLIPPFILLASLYFGAVLDPFVSLENLYKMLGANAGAPAIIGIVASGGVAIVAFGFIIGSFSVLILRILFWVKGQNYEAFVSTEPFNAIWKTVGSTKDSDTKKMLYLLAIYDHEILPESLHQWLGRRWNTVMVSFNCVAALLSAHLVGCAFHLAQTCTWWTTSVVLIAILLFNGLVARHQTMTMFEFLSFCSLKKVTKECKDANGK
jgi:hypothetical protein